MPPKISVLMPVYNCEKYLNEAVESILQQSYADFEFIIIDDHSTDTSGSIINRYQDPRIIFVHNDENIGVTRSLNRGLSLAQGEYIARMDADDISLPGRFEKQVSFLDAHPNVGVLGTAACLMDQFGKIGDPIRFPEEHMLLCWRLCFFVNPIIHPSVMMRRQLVSRVNGYNPELATSQDYQLWCRLSGMTRLANLPEIFLYLRKHAESISSKKLAEQKRRGMENSGGLLSEIMQADISQVQLEASCLAAWKPAEAAPQDFLQLAQLKYRLACVLLADERVSYQEKKIIANTASGELNDLLYHIHDIIDRNVFDKWINDINALAFQSPTSDADPFENDLFPGRPKILFIGLAESSHTRAWINLLEDTKFNVRLFSTPESILPPSEWQIRIYFPEPNLPDGLDPDFRKCMFPTPEERLEAEQKRLEAEQRRLEAERKRRAEERRNPLLRLKRLYCEGIHIIPREAGLVHTILGGFILLAYAPAWWVIKLAGYDKEKFNNARDNNIPNDFIGQNNRIGAPGGESAKDSVESLEIESSKLLKPKASSADEWLAQIIMEWHPDIVHTLGIFDYQGGEFYYAVRKKYNLEKTGTWVAQLRGGSDLTLRRHDPQIAPQITNLLSECDQILSDNLVNVEYAEELGIPRTKFASIIPVPGTGGIDVDEMAASCNILPSKRRLILVPKAYESIWSKVSTIFEGICLAWEAIQPCEVVFMAVNPEARAIYHALPLHIQQNCRIEERLPRSKLLALMNRGRVMLSPSLVDGVPNVLYEAMSCGVFPIVSPLNTITAVVKNEENVLFARNLYPEEIAAALVRAMQDDGLVDLAAENNLKRVRELADRKVIRPRVREFYESICQDHRPLERLK
jgi:glycosyltransferase involved in cell wall biosynthesis